MTSDTDSQETPLSLSDSHRTPHVVMVVANDVSIDTRVRRMAHDLAAAGLRVTVLGISPSVGREVTRLGGATIVRLPVPSTLSRAIKYQSARKGSRNQRPWVDAEAERQLFLSHQREIGAQIGWLQKDYFAARASRFRSADQRELVRRSREMKREETMRRLLSSVSRMRWRVPRALATRTIRWAIQINQSHGMKEKSRIVRRRDSVEERLHRTMRQREVTLRSELADAYANLQERVGILDERLDKTDDSMEDPDDSGTNWRDALPTLHDYDAVFGPELDRLAPDVVHAHDVHLLGVAARSVARMAVAGRTSYLIYDAHEYVQGLSGPSHRIRSAWSNLEREYIDRADRIITVSPQLADLLTHDFGLVRAPVVVMNIPAESAQSTRSVREESHVPNGVPLLVYSGGLTKMRGVHTLVEALADLEGVHLALVSRNHPSEADYVEDLLSLAGRRGLVPRIHLVPFVEPQYVVSHLRSATVGVHPLISGPLNHEIALPNKLFEYMHAHLPMVVSDCQAMADLVKGLEIGEVFESENPTDLAEKLKTVLDRIDDYQEAYRRHADDLEGYSWQAQRQKLLDVYRDLPGVGTAIVDSGETPLRSERVASGSDLRVALGPMNMAGQTWEWAKALEAQYPGLQTEVFEVIRPARSLVFPSDLRIDAASWSSLPWQLSWAQHIGTAFSHVLLESGYGALGNLNGGTLVGDLPFLSERGIRVAAVFHGSEVRDPLEHRARVAESPFQPGEELTERLAATTRSNLSMLQHFDGPVFVATLDLIDYIPTAAWLPITVSGDRWRPSPYAPASPLRVLFAPTNPILKGGVHVDRVGGRLQDEGLIELRVANNIAPDDMPRLVEWCDVLIDGLVLGQYGTTAIEGMASGRVVLGNLSRVIARLPEPSPIIDTRPETLEAVLRSIVADPDAFRSRAEEGPSFFRKYHSGQYSASQLDAFLRS